MRFACCALRTCFLKAVIAGLDPAIHLPSKKVLAKMMDPRIKPAGDATARRAQCASLIAPYARALSKLSLPGLTRQSIPFEKGFLRR